MGDYIRGTNIEAIKGHTRSLDYSSFGMQRVIEWRGPPALQEYILHARRSVIQQEETGDIRMPNRRSP